LGPSYLSLIPTPVADLNPICNLTSQKNDSEGPHSYMPKINSADLIGNTLSNQAQIEELRRNWTCEE